MPVQSKKPEGQEKPSESVSISKIKIELDDDGSYNQTKDVSERTIMAITLRTFSKRNCGFGNIYSLLLQNVKEVLPKVSVTLSDCLACSGCVTSAESVLISQQGPEELLKVLERNKLSKVNDLSS